eukprot:12660221-Alexandrium_andersonii.AAC.1
MYTVPKALRAMHFSGGGACARNSRNADSALSTGLCSRRTFLSLTNTPLNTMRFKRQGGADATKLTLSIGALLGSSARDQAQT